MTEKRRYLYALSVYVGTIMGVGLFALPYVGSKSGFFTLSIYLIVVGGIAITVNSFYAEIASKTDGLHRLPGYAEKYLGVGAKRIAFVVKVMAIFGALLAYLIIGGQFLANLFNGPEILYTFVFFLFGAFLIWKDKKSIGPVEFILLFIFLGIIVLLFIVGLPKINFGNLTTFSSSNIFAPYGVILFSLWGASIVPEIKEELRGNFKIIKKVIVTGIIICASTYFIFGLLVIGVSGTATSQDAISGLEGAFGGWVLKVGYVFGIIATFTSFIALGLTIKKLFWFDYKLPQKLGWFLASFVPLGLFIAGLRNFIDVIGLTGAVMLGLDGILITLIYLKLKKKENYTNIKRLKIFAGFLILLLATGVVGELFYYFRGF